MTGQSGARRNLALTTVTGLALLALPTVLSAPSVQQVLEAQGDDREFIETWLPPNDRLSEQVPPSGRIALQVGVANRTSEAKELPWRTEVRDERGNTRTVDEGKVRLDSGAQGSLTTAFNISCKQRRVIEVVVAEGSALESSVHVWVRPDMERLAQLIRANEGGGVDVKVPCSLQ